MKGGINVNVHPESKVEIHPPFSLKILPNHSFPIRTSYTQVHGLRSLNKLLVGPAVLLWLQTSNGGDFPCIVRFTALAANG